MKAIDLTLAITNWAHEGQKTCYTKATQAMKRLNP
jgi:hypothetical protein